MRQLEQGHARDRESLAGTELLVNGRPSLRRKFLWIACDPHHNVSIDENHLSRFHSFNGMTGLTTSPTIVILSCRKPKMSSRSSVTGTSLITGLPYLVMITGCDLAWTSSMMARHLALKTPAGIVFSRFDVSMVITN